MTFFHKAGNVFFKLLQDETWIAHDKILHVTWLEEKKSVTQAKRVNSCVVWEVFVATSLLMRMLILHENRGVGKMASFPTSISVGGCSLEDIRFIPPSAVANDWEGNTEYCWWFRNPARKPPGIYLKPGKQWDFNYQPQLVSRILSINRVLSNRWTRQPGQTRPRGCIRTFQSDARKIWMAWYLS